MSSADGMPLATNTLDVLKPGAAMTLRTGADRMFRYANFQNR